MASITLLLRPRLPGDDGRIARLSERSFASFAESPVGAVRRMIGEDGARTEVALLDGEFAGFMVVRCHDHPRDYGPLVRPIVAHLDAIAVEPKQQRRGIGRQLVIRAEALATKRGALAMFLMTAVENKPARRLFEHRGFRNAAAVPDAYGAEQRAVIMTKLLAAGSSVP
jgi:ribosomal protein S18 acetylase RimI-like enzyme